MSIEGYSLNEHFDYITHFIPQPFGIACGTVKEFTVPDYTLTTTKGTLNFTKSAFRKVIDALGIKLQLLSYVADETSCISLAMPIINKLFKHFSNCFVFYCDSTDSQSVIDVNCHSDKGEEGTIYENGPSPWSVEISKSQIEFTCFNNFMKYWSDLETIPTDVMVKSDDIVQGSKVVLQLYKEVKDSRMQPMLIFSGKYSNMSGFNEIHPALYDTETGVLFKFPMNYAKSEMNFDEMWSKVLHINSTTDVDDYVFREINELSASKDTPANVKNFITDLLINNTLNVNQPIKDILNESVTLTSSMKPAKKTKFLQQVGSLIAYSLCMKHTGCEHCGHIEIN